MKQVIILWISLMLMIPTFASAHVMNEKNTYGDIGYSEASEDILLLSGMGIIFHEHGDALFRPTESLQRSDLAAWAGSFFRLGSGEENIDQLKQLALQENLVTSLIGNATYEDINQAFFKGKVKVENPEEELKREEFAIFVADHLTMEIEEGKTLYDVAGYVQGPKGIIENVKLVEETTDVGQKNESYLLLIDKKEYLLAAHPRVTRAVVDPVVWEGQQLEQSWFSEEDGEMKLQQLVFSETVNQEENNEAAFSVKDEQYHSESNQEMDNLSKTVTVNQSNLFSWVYLSIGIILIGAVILIAVKSKQRKT